MNVKTSDLKGLPSRALRSYREETGQSLLLWAFIAAMSFLTQIMLRRGLLPGEFGTVNTALGVIGLATVPLAAVDLAFVWHLSRKQGPERKEKLEALRAAGPLITEMFAWAWCVVAALSLIIVLPMLLMPRFSLQLFTMLNVLIALGGVLSGVMCRYGGRLRLWAWLLVSAAAARVILSVWLTTEEPWAESGLATFLIAGLITFAPALKPTEADETQRMKALRAVMDRAFLVDLGAVFSVLLAIFLFSSADRIVAQSWFGAPVNNNIGYVDWPMFDAYQTAGLLGRSILWGTQPLLLLMFIRRSQLEKTTAASLDWFWIYLGALITGVTLLEVFKQPLSELFCGKNFASTAHLVPVFAATMIPLGLLQGLGTFALASRRYQECFVLGGCGIGYLLLLYLVGRQPALMPTYMFGGGLVALMIVLFVGVVRWGRKQP